MDLSKNERIVYISASLKKFVEKEFFETADRLSRY